MNIVKETIWIVTLFDPFTSILKDKVLAIAPHYIYIYIYIVNQHIVSFKKILPK
jgi:hypothetical protein